ncbi:sterol desaturase/sphingolipid hydroxylase (fatty acid hydroxylase superfamily) [Wenyingzhuangia heitensis]|uniref:Sterol desaturase/sphingolipid hydroxylase (Fatty acid hydroxylase superfamily) n=1 Tax=Wenyingzhuangia heitensis TaxID=1487859 RepID=A0ABX0UFL1_9FLAO|nr:sterol desaturase family protein [Wenyingzhuangia heitensis]NIJ46211.1 sterol desaturase/sphingolipid hydroxylase (fatty acid hydroxylase superfamily) [Wenyingzhuangia heitensis]
MKEEISLMPKGDNAGLFIVVSIVMFVLATEYIVARRKGKKIFRFENTIANISMGIFDRIAGVFMVPIIFFFYHYLHEYFAIFKIPQTTEWFLVAVLVSDFVWYFYHKSGHRINLFWGSHIIHHQSEDYNYSVAFNLTPFQVFIRILFWTSMPIIGFSAEVVLGTHAVLGLYQFLLHTPLIPKLGILEEFMVTPSHHRVHHGSNTAYLDKNYGGIFIIWDRLFGTFQREEEEVKYGITMDINSRDFVTGVFHYYANLFYLMRQMPTLQGKLNVLFQGPDWVPATGELEHLPLYVEKGSYQYKNYSLIEKISIIGNIALVVVVLCTMSYKIADIPTYGLEVMTFFMLVTLVSIGRMVEKQSVIFIEIFKYGVVAAYILYSFL